MLPKADLGGVGVTRAEPAEIAAFAADAIRRRDRAHTLAAVNVHTWCEARRDPAYRAALNDASVAFVDGVPIRWLLRAARIPPPARIHGADLMSLLLERLEGARHLFFGSTPEVLEELQAALRARLPALRVAGAVSPPRRRRAVLEAPDVLERLNGAGADVLWVALGAPKQEHWARLNRPHLRIPVVACVGAAFEIHAGRYGRAPRGLQRLGLEWAWRLAQDPWRLWRRYFATNGAFAVQLAKCWLAGGVRG